jgi:PAS domain S-box-containing protein
MNTEETTQDAAAKPLRLLVVEDSPRDAEIVVREIRRGGFEVAWKRVDTAEAMRVALDAEPWDAIISDYNLPRFDGLASLRVLQEKAIDIPFIIVSGTIGEEAAVALMKAGAHDFSMKNNLARLVPAIERELREAANRRAHKTMEEALRASELRYRRLFESAKDGILILDADTGMVVDVNPFLIEMLGYPREEFLEKRIWELGSFKNVIANQDKFTELQQAEYIRYKDLPLEDCKGQLHSVEFISNVYLVNGLKVIQCNIRDISQRKKAEEAVWALSSRQVAILSAIPDIIMEVDCHKVYRWANQAGVDFFGKDVIGKEAAFYFEGEETVYRTVEPLFDGDEHVIHIESWQRRQDGEKRLLLWSCRVLKDTQGNVTGALSSAHDITERKQLETYREMGREVLQILNDPGALPETLQRVINAVKTRTGFDAVGLRLQDGEDFPYYAQEGLSKDFLLTENTLLERDAGGGVCRDKDGNVSLECTCGLVISGKTDAASPLFTMRGSFWTNDSFPLLELPPEKDPRHHPRNQCIHQGYGSVALVPIRNHERIVGLLHLNDRRKGRFSVEMIEILEGIAAHIGAALMRKRAETAVLESEKQYRQLFEANSDGIAMVDTETKAFTRVNAALCRMLGYPVEELTALHVADIHPKDDLPTIMKGFEDASRNAMQGTMTMCLLRKDGQIVHVEVKANTFLLAGRQYNLAIFRDISERKQAEAEHEKLQAQFTQAQKMESVGRLAGGVAHDFNNLLMGTMGYTQLCLDKIGPDHPIREYLDEIMSVTERSAELTRQLLAFARKQIIAPTVMDLNDAISDILKLLRRLIGEDVTMKFTEDPDTWPVKMDPVQIDQILANLCVNARDAIGGVGSVNIETSNATFDESYCARHQGSVPGDYALLTVTDTGCGMDKETLENIFEPFFTTKGVGEGTGLGLATVYGIVKQNNGYITVYSEHGKGTTFKIYLPRHVCEETALAAVAAPAKSPHGTETVLLVEDEKSIRITTRLFLEDIGYTVLVAEDPAQALNQAAAYSGEIHLLITDVVMPGMSGRDLANRLLELRPTIKRLFISGFTADVIAQRGILGEDMNFLSKPFGRDTLAHKVREVLEEEGEKK